MKKFWLGNKVILPLGNNNDDLNVPLINDMKWI